MTLNIQRMRAILKPAFQMAFEDDLIRKNPFQFDLASVIKDDTLQREPLTEEQMENLLSFIKNHKIYSRYYNGIYILFHTGLRISEFCGLTLKDINLKEKTICVNHQMYWIKDGLHIEETKTKSGTRIIPITEGVCECFRNEIKTRKPKDVIIDGYGGFIFLSSRGNPADRRMWYMRLKSVVDKYNEQNVNMMPKVTPHICRHTFCTRMAKSGMNPKVLQYIMGHSDISITLNVYTHLKLYDAKTEMIKLNMMEEVS